MKSHAFFRAVQEGAHLFQGITDGTMSHGEGWQHIQLGRYVERADTLACLMETHFKRTNMTADLAVDQVVESAEYLEWVGLLRACVGLRSVLQSAHRCDPSPPRGRLFGAQSRIPAFHPFRCRSSQRGASRRRRLDRAQSKNADANRRKATRATVLQFDRRNHGRRRARLSRKYSQRVRSNPRGDTPGLFRLRDRRRMAS